MRKIAAKVLKQINKANTKKIIDLNVYRQQKKETEDLFNQIITTEIAIKNRKSEMVKIRWAHMLHDLPE